ncbi:MAG: Galactose-1-phosphate uridylyltransferase [Tenericutes bacterium ADurb.Bin239]|nr:MAG: Galactose-1-phosphate uridylyltransferase [Tenericutes bacterium ADurb.Bin239]
MVEILVEKLLTYAELKLALSTEDVKYYRNVLLNKFGLKKPYKGVINVSEIHSMNNPQMLIDELCELIKTKGLPPHLSFTDPEAVIVDILGMMTPIPSVVNYRFAKLLKKDSNRAIKYLYDLSIANNYIQQAKIDANIRWTAPLDVNYFEMTINLAKPEKDNKEVAKLLTEKPEDKYPSCPLCLENVGFGGNETTPPRQNLRAVPLMLDKEIWYLQYSPFVYYKDHIIVISEEHNPMTITPRIFSKLVAFVDLFPNLFIGSNSDIPIVGGSILNHEHFQGGAKVMPMFKAKDRYVLRHKNERKIKISILEWDSNVIKLESTSKRRLLEKAAEITANWLNYTNEELGIIPFTGETRHAAVTPIVVKEKRKYIMYIILRNNRTDDKYPTGIFHAHPEYHNIKKEGIGLIEQMGTFILPARLKSEFGLMEELYKKGVSGAEMISDHPTITKHAQFIKELMLSKIKPVEFETYAKNYMTEVCQNILRNTACFKADAAGQAAFIKFLQL